MDDITKQIEQMLDFSTKAPGTSAPGTESPGTEAPGTTAPATEAPSTDAPADSDYDRQAKLIEETKKIIEDLKSLKPSTKAPSTKAPTTDAPRELRFVADEDELDEVTRNPEKFNFLMNKVYKAGMEAAAKYRPPSDINKLVMENVDLALTLRAANEQFYKDNEDLLSHKDVVAKSYVKVATEHPNWSVKQCLDETSKVARKEAGLSDPSARKAKPKAGPTLPPGTKGGGPRSTQPQKKSKLQSEIDAMLDAE